MTHSATDIDLTQPAGPPHAEPVPVECAPHAMSYGSAKELEFTIWDGRTVVMRRLPLPLSQQINMGAFDKEPGNPIKANQIGRLECIKASLKRVGGLVVGRGGETSESLYAALSDPGLEHAQLAYNLMNTTTDEQDAAFLVSIVAR